MTDNFSPPWGKFSKRIDDSMSVEDILTVTGADYDVILSPVQVENIVTGKFVTVKDRFVTGRLDISSGAMINWEVVKGRYEVLPNSILVEKTKGLYSSLKNRQFDCSLDFSSTIEDGRKYFTSIRMADSYCCGDEFANYIVIMTSHDGSSPITYYFLNVRKSTGTVFRISNKFVNNYIKKRHTPSTEAWKSEHNEVIDQLNKWNSYFYESLKTLHTIDYQSFNVMKVLDVIWPEDDDSSDRKIRHRQEVKSIINKLYNAEYNSEQIGKNGLALFSSACDYYDNYRNVSLESSAEQALELDNFVNRMKIDAYEKILGE